jgi:sRNA-binding carbon storage regulator CsrA
MVKVRYVGSIEGETIHVGIMKPGEVKTVNKEIAEVLLRGNFELVKEIKKEDK